MEMQRNGTGMVGMSEFQLPQPESRLVVYGDTIFKLRYRMRCRYAACYACELPLSYFCNTAKKFQLEKNFTVKMEEFKKTYR